MNAFTNKMLTAVGLLIAAILILVGCSKEAERIERTTNADIQVGLLFEKDGYRVYRFADGGRWVYYVVPSGQATAIWSESCGKNCIKEVHLQSFTKGVQP